MDLCGKTTEQPIIIRGENKTLTITITNKEKTPIDMTGVSEITAKFKKQDSTVLEKKLSLGGIAIISEAGGKFAISLIPADTADLAIDEDDTYSDIEVSYVIGGAITIVQLRDSIQVKASLFPA